jgi:hypothetical protein
MGSGSNYGLVLNSADYANAKVPLMFFGNDTGIAYENFNAFTHSSPKYLVDIAGLNHHVGGYQSSWCQDFHNSMIAVNPGVFPQAFINPAPLNPTDIADYVFDATFYFSYTGPRELGIYNFCPASVFDGISGVRAVRRSADPDGQERTGRFHAARAGIAHLRDHAVDQPLCSFILRCNAQAPWR